jgi:hypothetical protein
LKRQLAFALILGEVLAGVANSFAADPLTAFVEKMRGNVIEAAADGGVPLRTGKSVQAGRKVTVGRFSLAIYNIEQRFLLKQDPRTSLEFNGISHPKGPNGAPEWDVSVNLDNGDLYTALRPTGEKENYEVTTSRIYAITHGAIFKVSHAYSTSTVSVKEGSVDVYYCYRSKHKLVRAGETFTVTDCEGLLRWQSDEEGRQLILFGALLSSGFGPLDGIPDDSQFAEGDDSGAQDSETVQPPEEAGYPQFAQGYGTGPGQGGGALDNGYIDPEGSDPVGAANYFDPAVAPNLVLNRNKEVKQVYVPVVPANLPPISP